MGQLFEGSGGGPTLPGSIFVGVRTFGKVLLLIPISKALPGQKHFGKLWKNKIPLKIQVFLCQLVRKRLPSNDNIRRRHEFEVLAKRR
jgi:hypothetical protein